MLSDTFATAEPSVKARLVAVLHERIPEEVEGFANWWPHEIVYDGDMIFNKAVFGGELVTSTVTGFLVSLANPWSKLNANRLRVKDSPVGKDHNLKGDGLNHGGLFVVRPHGTGIAFKFAEEAIGDAAEPRFVLASARSAL
mmetsp:Transcript_21137/g.63516  ORF Transcript_21137/g.63516 Transcript_21137/m.63516 type:complete len:141 (-) Transcript_21137:18-440(-)